MSNLKKMVFAKTDGRCWYCGARFEKERCMDHVIPRSLGGGDVIDNLVPCCRSCNSTKGPRSVEYLRKVIRMRNAGMVFSQDQIDWLLQKGFDILRVIPEYRFYFEIMSESGGKDE